MSAPFDVRVIYPNNRRLAYGQLNADIPAITPPVWDIMLVHYLKSQGKRVDFLDAEARGFSAGEVARLCQEFPAKLVVISTDNLNSGDVCRTGAALGIAAALSDPGQAVMLYGNTALLPVPAGSSRILLCDGEPFAFARNYPLRTDHRMLPDASLIPPTDWSDARWHPQLYKAHHWHCFDRLTKRVPYAALYTALGCPHRCSFCGVNTMAGKPNYRPRPLKDVLAELTQLSRMGVVNVRLCDNDLLTDPARVEALCYELRARDLRFNMWAYARADSIREEDSLLLRRMREAGIRWLGVGFETTSPESGAAVRKKQSNEHAERVIEWCRSAGVHLAANFMFGLPGETRDSMEKTLAMALRHNFPWVNFSCVMAYPGTELHAQALAEGWPLPKTWGGYSQYSPDALPLPTATLSSADILAFRDSAFRRYFDREEYRTMLERTFGSEAPAYVNKILACDLERRSRVS